MAVAATYVASHRLPAAWIVAKTAMIHAAGFGGTPLPLAHRVGNPVEVAAGAGGVCVYLLGLAENLSLHEQVAQLQHVSDALLVENLLLALLHAALMPFGLVEVDHLLHRAGSVVAHGGEEEVHGVDAVVVHRVPRRDLRRPALLHGDYLLTRLLDALGERLIAGLHLRVGLVDGGVLSGAPLVGGLGNDPVQNRADDGGQHEIDDVPNHHLKLHAAHREERNGYRVRDCLQRGARDERERDEEARYGVEHGMPLGLLLRLGSELRAQLVDAVLQPHHAMHQIVRCGDSR